MSSLLLQFEIRVDCYSSNGGQHAQELVGGDAVMEEQVPSQEGHTELAVANHVVALELVVKETKHQFLEQAHAYN